MPSAITIFHADGPAGRQIEAVVSFVESQTSINGAACACVCENYVCKLPVSDIDKLKKILAKVEKPFTENENANENAADSTVGK